MKKKTMTFVIIGIFCFVLMSIFMTLYILIPDRKSLTSCFTTKMFEVYLCPGGKDYVPLNQISKYMQKTVVLTEDSLFFEHKGFDWESIEKSAKENFKDGKIKRGGSTISQQLAKNLFLTKEKTLVRKMIEAFLTFQIEKHLTKKEILEKYLNVVEFGKNIYGIKHASAFYFKKRPSDLDVVESAFLATLLPNPIKYSSSFYKKQLSDFVFKRIKKIISDMLIYHRISVEEFNQAKLRFSNFMLSDVQLAALNSWSSAEALKDIGVEDENFEKDSDPDQEKSDDVENNDDTTDGSGVEIDYGE